MKTLFPSSTIAALVWVLCCSQSGSSPALSALEVPNIRQSAMQDVNSLIQTVSYRRYGLDIAKLETIGKENLWVLGRGRESNRSEEAVLLYTSDRGLSWNKLFAAPNQWLYDLCFVNAQMGWMVGHDGLILKSTDGGRSWARRIVPTRSALIDVQFVDSQSGWTVGSDGEFLRSTDGGDTWRSHKLEGFGWDQTKERFRGWISSFQFSDRFVGWIIGERGKLFQTIDGGITWRSRGKEVIEVMEGPQATNVEFVKVQFIDRNLGFIAANVRDGNNDKGTSKGVVFRTDDGGRTWDYLVVTKDLGLGDAQFLNRTEAWIITLWGNRVLHTRDRGRMWVDIASPSSQGATLQIHFIDAKYGWLIADNGKFLDDLFFTQNGGQTWSQRSVLGKEN